MAVLKGLNGNAEMCQKRSALKLQTINSSQQDIEAAQKLIADTVNTAAKKLYLYLW